MKEISPELTIQVRDIMRSYGSGYYKSARLFPHSIREDIWLLYAFVRIPDEIVDNGISKQDSEEKLNLWMHDWEHLWKGEDAQGVHPVLVAAHALHIKYSIPFEYSVVFLDAMRQDLSVERYKTYTEVEDYMFGSAGSVGYMMSYIIGFQSNSSGDALVYAKALAEAMQLTNFLRDIDEDYVLRNRIYIPEADMQRFGVTEDHIKSHIVDDAWITLMKYEIDRARTLYTFANKGIALLHPQGQKAVRAASFIYEGILTEIEKAQYNVFLKRVKVSRYKKTLLLFKALWNLK